ncbi:hypothetical protein DD238_005750 [Peronospora effusa]|uniref:DNA 3'-5' helicase n=1 Tax=Peronospora effusa TaxID=542832 RepID=A0A3M6V766_9STRA|nr:hypothetical protein DD238_005750 [Peronospora effusa]
MIKAESELVQIEQELREVEEDLNVLLLRQSELLERKKELHLQLECEEIEDADVTKNTGKVADWKAHFQWSEQIHTLLTETFHLPDFRSVQEEVSNATLLNKDVFVVMRTGGGKSLCYQLPALVDGNAGFTVVISPLLSLIQDQVMLFNDIAGEGAACRLSSEQSRGEASAIYKSLITTDSALRILLITPEKLIKSKLLMSRLKRRTRLGD